MKHLFKGAVPTIALLLVAVMSLTSVTYAWFTAGETATVETIDVNVKTVEGLLVSNSGFNGTWGSTLKPTTGTTQALQDASSAGTLTGEDGNAKAMVFYNVTYDNTYDAITSATAARRESGSYDNWIEFPIYIKNEGNGTVTVNLNGSSVTGSALSRAVARVAFVKQGTTSATAVVNDGQEPTFTYSPVLLGIWEPNSTEHTSEGETWLTNNGQSKSGSSAYKAVDGTMSAKNGYLNVATGYTFTKTSETIQMTAKSSEEQTIDDKTVTVEYYDESNLPKDGEYYVYTLSIDTVAGEHFRRLTVDDFFKPLSVKDAVDATGTIANKSYTKTTVSGVTRYVLVRPEEEIDGTKYTYYQLKDGGTTPTCLVDVYECDKYVGGDTNVNVVGENNATLDAAGITALTTVTSSNVPKYKINEDDNAAEGVYYVFDYKATTECYRALTVEDFFKKYENKADAATAFNSTPTPTSVYTYSSTNHTFTKVTEAATITNADAATVFYYYASVATTSKLNNGSILKNVVTNSTREKTSDTVQSDDFTFDIEGNTIVKITCYIWIEGQDCDCTNYVAGNPFKVNLQLNKVAKK